MRKDQYLAQLFVLTAVLLPGGCKKDAGDDSTVTAAVQTRLSSDSALSSESIQSSVQAGIATLTGTVSSEAARALAANDAAQVSGVRTVVNNLTVQSATAVPVPQALPVAVPPVVESTPPSRIRPAKPTAAVDRERIRPVTPPAQMVAPPAPAPIERASQPVVPQPVAPAQPAFRNVSISAGTSIPVRITQTLDSASTEQGQTFSGTVASDVVVDGLVAIPQGAAVSGRVDAVQEAAHFKGNSLLTISLTNISRRGGASIPVSTEAYSKEGSGRGKNTAVKTGVGAAAGAVLGGIFGGGKGAAIGAAAGGGTGAGINAVTRGQQVQIPSESLIPFHLSNSVDVRVRSDGRGANRESRDNDQNNTNQNDGSDLHRRPLN